MTGETDGGDVMEMTEADAEKIWRGGSEAFQIVRQLYADMIRKLDGFEQDASLLLDACKKLPLAWIPVTERLPDDGVRVLAWDSREGCARVAYVDAIFFMVGFDEDTPICVSHWMSLPEPPEVK